MQGLTHELDAIELCFTNLRREMTAYCTCDKAYKGRALRDPQCAYCDRDQYMLEQLNKGLTALAALRAARLDTPDPSETRVASAASHPSSVSPPQSRFGPGVEEMW